MVDGMAVLFFDGQLYHLAASWLLPDLLQVLRQGSSTNMELLALGAHPHQRGVNIMEYPRAFYLDTHGCKGAP